MTLLGKVVYVGLAGSHGSWRERVVADRIAYVRPPWQWSGVAYAKSSEPPRDVVRDRERRRAYERGRERRNSKAFYSSSAWRSLREKVLRKNQWCAMCRTERAVTVHHVLHLAARPDLALVESNLEALCDACHKSLH